MLSRISNFQTVILLAVFHFSCFCIVNHWISEISALFPSHMDGDKSYTPGFICI